MWTARMLSAMAAFVVIAVTSGCASSAAFRSEHPVAPLGAAPDLTGTWYGGFGQVSASLYEGESNGVLRINSDGTFTASITRGLGTNNLAKPTKWEGTVAAHGKRITLQNTLGPWAWITLTRSGDDVLYGVANDPGLGAPVMIRFERGDST